MYICSILRKIFVSGISVTRHTIIVIITTTSIVDNMNLKDKNFLCYWQSILIFVALRDTRIVRSPLGDLLWNMKFLCTGDQSKFREIFKINSAASSLPTLHHPCHAQKDYLHSTMSTRGFTGWQISYGRPNFNIVKLLKTMRIFSH